MNLKTTASCPLCGNSMEFSWETTSIPHFGDALMIAGTCPCGFRHNDTMLLTQREPYRYTLPVESQSDLDARVIRSASGTVRVPEIGVDVEPGYASESYITNVEGVLVRIRDIVKFATNSARQAGDQEKTARGEDILERIGSTLDGRGCMTLILEDPFGNSAIISSRAEAVRLTEEEVGRLKCGMVVLDVSSS
ncbi:MAG: ZPR1 zinc-finger domain protein [Methanosaeta sp. PtaB.Bin039]|nr:MAG: ZPR1 zinc-finger domain protein [Methanosaeta sp. PtaB.Bin039]OPY45121.1 MAG: ZPR1 zinc-finger domain protein [Methanosaeta sp. PtaU1.Bin028]HOT07040.1 ZPR1 zinc finger domain-containing protein [Methanotrichaceae archaeon]HQF16032.1 ZPR1 zinc finger domain-containing protein [Methanotrichaceae archaeon]HQI90852.1 ZPR1 zinc finger domain-containing protein [Methanotrichaceae archaeon]